MANKTTNYKLTKPTADDFYNVDVPNGNMDIIDAELKKLDDGKASSNHGLGTKPKAYGYTDCKELIQHGCGFYQIDEANDRPTETDSAWKPMIQLGAIANDGKEYGVQLLMSQNDANGTNMWMRRVTNGKSHDWVTMIHTGNATSLLPFLKIANGSYVGTGGKTYKFTFDFQPKIFFFDGCFAIPYGTTLVSSVRSGLTVGMKLTWDGNSVTIGDRGTDYGFPWHFENATYYYAAIG